MSKDFQMKEMLREHTETVLTEQFKDDRLSISDIAEIWSCSDEEMVETLRGFGILKRKK